MNIILAGIMGKYPYGGVAWCSLMYLLGLRDLGHNVWYLEDTGECNIDPVQNTVATEPTYALRFIDECLRPYDLHEKWCYIDYRGNYFGHTKEAWRRVCSDADLFLNLSGGCWFWRDEYASIPRKAFIDSDPAFTQLAIAKGVEWYVDFFRQFDRLFTFGSNIGTDRCSVPVGDFTWHHTWQPIVMDEWRPSPDPPRPVFTTIMNWQIESFQDIGGNKDEEFLKYLDVPSCTNAELEIAVAGAGGAPIDFLRKHGWACRSAFEVSRDPYSYRSYIQNSSGEFSVAKHTYVHTNSGWFSDRSECYLAAGRPVIVQDTGFTSSLPCGVGLLAHRGPDEAIAAIDQVRSDAVRHSKAAVGLAEEHFSHRTVLPDLVDFSSFAAV